MTTTRTVATRPLDDRAISDISAMAEEYALANIAKFPPLQRAVKLAAGITGLREAVQPLMPSLMPLKGSPLGFLTDERADKPPYPMEVVRDCFVEALLRGLRPVGNEWNIIAGRCYTALAGYQRLVEEFPGLTDLRTANTPPFVQGGHTCVKCSASWILSGVPNQLRDHAGKPGQIYAVVAHQSTGIDAKIGKARRRMYKAIWGLISGTHFTEPDVGEEAPELPAPADADTPRTRTQEVIDQLQSRKNGGQADVTAPGGSPAPSFITEEQKAEIGKLRHVISSDELQLLIEQKGVFDVDQLTYEGAKEIVIVLETAHRSKA